MNTKLKIIFLLVIGLLLFNSCKKDRKTVSVTSPDSNTEWKPGEFAEIKWSGNYSGNVKIILYNWNQPIFVIDSPVFISDSYNWIIPEYLSDNRRYRILVQSISEPSVYAYSQFFSISELGGLSTNPEIYNGISQELKQDVFIEDFDNNSNSWLTEYSPGEYIAEISSGYYNIQNMDYSYSWLFWKEISYLDESQNFEIETSIKLNYEISGDGNGFFWGFETGNHYGFFEWISSNNNYKIAKKDNGSWYNWQDWIYSEYVNDMEIFNKLTVRKYNDEYYFFINESFVFQYSKEYFQGDFMGFWVNSQDYIVIDYLYVYEISEIEKTYKNIAGKSGTSKIAN